jgi:hypothetical protein
MPSKNIDYSKTIIYKIVCNDLAVTDIYIGSTTKFTTRRSHHKGCSKKSDRKIYQTIRDNGGWENWTMIQIEEYPCANSNESRARERYWYEQLHATLNKNTPNRNKKEYYEDNKTKIIEQAQNYRGTHKVEKAEYQKHYYTNNKEAITEHNKQYVQNNIEVIREKRTKKITCICGAIFSISNKAQHEKSQKHINQIKK